MKEDIYFSEKDPLGRIVELSNDQYINHIVVSSGHNEFRPEDIQTCIKSPEAIYKSAQQDNRCVYVAHCVTKYPKLSLQTITQEDTSEKGHVVTAYLAKKTSGVDESEGGLLYVGVTNRL